MADAELARLRQIYLNAFELYRWETQKAISLLEFERAADHDLQIFSEQKNRQRLAFKRYHQALAEYREYLHYV